MTQTTSRECQEILASIAAYLDGDLDATTCQAIEQHCQVCTRCAALVSGLRETVGLCRQAASVPLPEAIRHRARESVRRLLDKELTNQPRAHKCPHAGRTAAAPEVT
jgi:anti-sigma factor RsiW